MEFHAALLFSLLLASASLLLHADSKELPAERPHRKEQPNNKIPDELWDYANVRTDAYMFWWLYGCMNSSLIRENRPLVMWLQVGAIIHVCPYMVMRIHTSAEQHDICSYMFKYITVIHFMCHE